MLSIKVLGSGCANCHKVEEIANKAAVQLGVNAQVELITDIQTIMRYGVMSTPAIVINEQVVSTGRVPALSQVTSMIVDALEHAK